MTTLYQLLTFSLLSVAVQAQPGLLNRAPQFLPNGDMSRFAIPEDTPVGSAVYKLLGSDPEGSKVIYSISGEYFTVDKDTGVVTTLKSFDRERQDLITVVISVTDEGVGGAEPNTVSLLREIPVLDINDNSPIFYNRPYSFRLFENTATGKKLFENITVQDLDGGINGDVILSCFPPHGEVCTTFDITTEKVSEGLYKGVITLRRELDFETRTSYSLTVKATDRAKDPSRRLTATANVAIDVMDIQDQPPVFVNAPYSATIPENTEEGTSILRVGARDGDVGDPRVVRIDLENDHLGYFQLVPVIEKGTMEDALYPISYYDIVTTNVPLDREHPDVLQNGGIYTFTVKATELINNELPAEYSETIVTVVITDEDDQLPVFNHKLFHINVSEDITMDSPLPGLNMIITDKDIGENAQYFLSLREIQNVDNTFAVHPKAGSGHTAVVVRVNDTTNLDYDVQDESLRTLIFEVVAGITNEYKVVREVANSRVVVHLQDANDNAPVFANQSYYLSVPEDIPVKKLVYNVTATDKDSGTYGTVRYYLKGFGAQKFKTDYRRGGIYISSMSLDYETQKSYNLNLIAIDGGNKTTSTNIYVDVEDVNDNKPTFESKEYSRIIREKATSFQPEFFIHAVDVDGPKHGDGKIMYEIVSTNYNGEAFSIDKDSGELKINKPVSANDTPKGQYEMVVRAWDYGLPRLYEDVRVNVRVGVFGNQRPYFKGNSKNKNGVSIYKINIKENTKPNEVIKKLEAVDPDGVDTKLNYFIVSGGKDNFVVDETTGMLKTSPYSNLDIDKNPSSYELQVITIDSGIPVPETGSTSVIITVEDVNDKPPFFSENTYTKYLVENADVNSTVLSVIANDTDESSEIRYRIIKPMKIYDKSGLLVNSNDDLFLVNNETGEIVLNQRLNHDLINYLVLKIEAEDLKAEENNQKATTEVLLYIQASSDQNPVFLSGNWTIKNPVIKIRINEEIDKNTIVYTLKAKDPLKDETKVKYEVFENDYIDIFNVSENGNVIILKKLDYENLPRKVYNVSVRAVIIEDLHYDINKKSSKETVLDLQNLPKVRYTDSVLNIEVVNINDNAPIFKEDVYKRRVLESVKFPEMLLKAQAKDKDNDTVKYSITGENANYFVINQTTGEVSVAPNVSLDREKRNVYKFNVTASDKNLASSTKIHKTSVQVFIEVLDVNDNPPIFSRSLYSTVVPENADIGTMIMKIQAADSDLGLSGEVRYKIIEESEALGFFKIDSDTGEISTNRILTGKGRNDPYNIIIKAADKGDQVLDSNGKQNQASLSSEVTLSIYIGDVVKNDGVPVFIRPTLNQRTDVSENASVGTPVFQVIATDPDDANSAEGQIRYKFLDDGRLGDDNPFRINSESGLISTKLPLDREMKSSYDLLVVAQDRGDVPQQATRLLHVEILDVDDHKPTFKRLIDDPPMQLRVTEESPLGTEVGLIQAFDDDVGENALIDYIISYGNEETLFNVTRTEDNIGVIRVTGRIDREQAASHLITVKCFKMTEDGKKLNYLRPYNRQDPSERQVLIRVDDIDDNSPRFEKPNVTIGVRLNVPPDTTLITLKAEDADIDSPPLEYYVGNVSFTRLSKYSKQGNVATVVNEKLFQADVKTGELKTCNLMQKYSDGFFDVSVFAKNSQDVAKQSNMSVRVFMLRDKGLMRFVFNDPPTNVKKRIPELEAAVAAAISQPASVNVYDTQFHSKKDGSLDFSSTSSCFQIIGKEPYSIREMEALLHDPKNKALNRVFSKFNIEHVGRCAGTTAKAETSWVQIWVLVIAALIGVLAMTAACTLCCMYRRYKRKTRRKVTKTEAPSTADYMTIRTSGPHLGGSQMMPSSGSVLGSQLIIPSSQFGGSQMCISKSDRSVLGSQLLVPKGSQLIINQPATQMGSQLIINTPKTNYSTSQSGYSVGNNGPIIMGSSQMLVPNNTAIINDGDYEEQNRIFVGEDMGSQVMYEYVRDGADNLGYIES